jgi:hypothetical protein
VTPGLGSFCTTWPTLSKISCFDVAVLPVSPLIDIAAAAEIPAAPMMAGPVTLDVVTTVVTAFCAALNGDNFEIVSTPFLATGTRVVSNFGFVSLVSFFFGLTLTFLVGLFLPVNAAMICLFLLSSASISLFLSS